MAEMKGKDLKTTRKEYGWTQSYLGKLIGVSKNTIINYEKMDIIPESKYDIIQKAFSQGKFHQREIGKKEGIIDKGLLNKAKNKSNPSEFLLNITLSAFHPTEIIDYINTNREEYMNYEEFGILLKTLSKDQDIKEIWKEMEIIKKKINL